MVRPYYFIKTISRTELRIAFVIALLCNVFHSGSWAQCVTDSLNLQAHFGGHNAERITCSYKLEDGRILACGQVQEDQYEYANSYIHMFIFDFNFNLLISKRMDIPLGRIKSIVRFEDGTFGLLGDAQGFSGGHMIYFNVDEDGNILHQRYVGRFNGNEYFGAACKTDDDNVVFSGRVSSGIQSMAIVMKIDQTGETLWTFLSSDSLSCTFLGVERTHNGDGFLVSGEAHNSSDQLRAVCIKLDNQGQLIWSHKYEVSESIYRFGGRGILPLEDNGAIIGTFYSNNQNGKPGLMRLDESGNVIWSKLLSSDAYLSYTGIYRSVEENSSIIVSEQLYCEVSDDGQLNWVQSFNTETSRVIYSLQPYSCEYSPEPLEDISGYIALGSTKEFSHTGFDDAWIAKLDSQGRDFAGCNQIDVMQELENIEVAVEDFNIGTAVWSPEDIIDPYSLLPYPIDIIKDDCTKIPNTDLSIIMYPNPATDKVMFRYKENFQIAKILLHNSQGALVGIAWSHSPLLWKEVDVSYLLDGYYIFEILSTQGETIMLPLVKVSETE